MEILPMLIRNDWYTVSIAGVQNVDPDESFKYTVSIIHSPLLVPFGVNLVGENSFFFNIFTAVHKGLGQVNVYILIAGLVTVVKLLPQPSSSRCQYSLEASSEIGTFMFSP